MVLHYINAEGQETTLDIIPDERSYRYRSIMGEHVVYLYFSLSQFIDIPIGAWIEFEGIRYELMLPAQFTKNSSENFSYDLTLQSSQEHLKKYIFRKVFLKSTGGATEFSPDLKVSYTAKPERHLQMLVDNLNYRSTESGWSVGECIDASEKLIVYDHINCFEALAQIADAFNTEWEIVNKTINLRKVEYNNSAPLYLAYGKNKGLKPDVGRINFENSNPIERLFVQGGERNIDASKYGYPTLTIPAYYKLGYDGSHFSDEDDYDDTTGRMYQAEDYQTITRYPATIKTGTESSVDYSNIYPKRIGKVTAVEKLSDGWDFWDSTIPDSLDYSDESLLIAGEEPIVVFQTGILAGREFAIVSTEDSNGNVRLSGYIHNDLDNSDDPTKKRGRFKLVSETIDGQEMPNDAFKPAIDDEYAVFNIAMPNAYIADNSTKTGASWDMFREAIKYFYENEFPKFSFTGELDGKWAREYWLNIGSKIKPGGCVFYSDAQFLPEGTIVRITGVKDYIHNCYSPEIELSNSPGKSEFSTTINKIEGEEVIVENLNKETRQYTKRRFRDATETMRMLDDALLKNFSESINPVSVRTMMLLIGDESLQFRFVNNTTDAQPVNHNVIYNKSDKTLTVEGGIIQHMTLGINSISSSHDVSDYKFWTLPEFQTPALTDSTKKYYLYAKVSRSTTSGTFFISEQAIAMEDVAGYYHLLVGILNSEYEGDRSYTSLYGFTEIGPGRITTDLIASSDGITYFDLLNGVINGKITFTNGSSGLKNIQEWNDVENDIRSKSRTFRSQPTPPYDIDDLWADGNTLRICIQAKTKEEKFNITDWVKATQYDNTKTAIDGGVVTSGTIQLAGSAGSILAGITGNGTNDDSVRIWAGGTFTNRSKAPFRVTQNGELYASNAHIEGSIVATSGTFSGFLRIPFVSLKDNSDYSSIYSQYQITDYFNLICDGTPKDGYVNIRLPLSKEYIGSVINLYDSTIKTRSSPGMKLMGNILHPKIVDDFGYYKPVTRIEYSAGGLVQLLGVPSNTTGISIYWQVVVDTFPDLNNN